VLRHGVLAVPTRVEVVTETLARSGSALTFRRVVAVVVAMAPWGGSDERESRGWTVVRVYSMVRPERMEFVSWVRGWRCL